jgi:integrase
MSPRKRLPYNRKLPERWVFKHGAYYYRPRKHELHLFDNKAWFRLGRELHTAHRVFADRIEITADITTMAELCDRYEVEILPGKAPATQRSNTYSLQRIRLAFCAKHNPVRALRPIHIRQYKDAVAIKQSKKKANLDLEVLSHLFTMAIEWGVIDEHIMTDKRVRKFSLPARDRYVNDAELAAFREVAGEFLNAYVDLKGITGLRKGDLLSIKLSDLQPDGLHVRQRKTAKPIIFRWSPALRAAVERIKALPRPVGSVWLFCTRDGQPYIKPDGTTSGFDSIWQRRMKKAVSDTALTERFRENDLRAKVASDADSDNRAQELLDHSDAATTRKHYRRKGRLITPAGGFKK